MLGGDFCNMVTGLVSMGSGSECHGASFRSQGNILRMYGFINSVRRSTSTAMFSTILNQYLTCEFPIHTERRMVPSGVVSSLIALHGIAVE